MTIGLKQPQAYPEGQHNKYAPEGDPHFIKKSEHVGRGHQDHPQRMAHPFTGPHPQDESGEGQDPSSQSRGSGLFPEQD